MVKVCSWGIWQNDRNDRLKTYSEDKTELLYHSFLSNYGVI